MAEHISLTFAFYGDRNLDFVVILHKVVQLHRLLSIESQRLNITQSVTRKPYDLKTVNGKLILSKDSSSTFAAPASLPNPYFIEPPICRSRYAHQFNAISIQGKIMHSHFPQGPQLEHRGFTAGGRWVRLRKNDITHRSLPPLCLCFPACKMTKLNVICK